MKARLLLLVAALVASLALAEAVLRFFPAFDPHPQVFVGEIPDRPSQHLVADPELGWRMLPNHEWIADTEEYHVRYRSNAGGFRDERTGDAAAKPHRIALVGDSVTFGFGVAFEQTYGALLESRLPGTAVLNFALPAFGLDQIWQALRTEALPARPDLVIVGFISDDFTRSLTAFRPDVGFNKPLSALRLGSLVRLTAQDRPPAWLRWLDRRSRLWAGAKEAVRLVGLRFGVGPWWNLNRAIVDQIRADCRASGARVLFVLLPLAPRQRFPAIAAYLERTGGDFLDLANSPDRPAGGLHFPIDGHPNAAGHRYIADALLAWIAQRMPELAAPRAPSG